MENPLTIASYLRTAAEAFPDKRAFGYLEDGSTVGPECTYAALLDRVMALAEYLRVGGLSGHPVLLLYPEGLDFITAFLACQEAQVVAVPMFLPRSNRHMARLGHILADVGACVILTTADLVAKIQTGLRDYAGYAQLHLLPTTAPLPATALPLLMPASLRGIAFVQYTSGSTGSPKGVVISHDNLLHNQRLLTETFGGTASSMIFSWLPFYHDMGLIGNILHAVYLGATCLLMSPMHFMQQPLRWLRAIDRYKVTHSGGPNFCYDLCADAAPEAELAGLDLRSWQVAYNGAEPVKRTTMDRFVACFGSAGLNRSAFHPCYGLAEATLLVAGVKAAGTDFRSVLVDRAALNEGQMKLLPETAAPDAGIFLVSSGQVPAGMEIRILGSSMAQGITVGEIVLAGGSVSRGYWPLPEGAQTAAATDTYLPTGDLGFLHDGHLFVTGRKKELMIIRGKNYYPYDIETTCATAHPALQRNAAVAVAVSIGEQEQLVVLAEIRRTNVRGLDVAAVKTALHNRVVESVGLAPFDIVLLGPLSIPRTSSGKLQRTKCGQLYQDGAFDQKRLDTPAPATSPVLGNRAALLEQLKAGKESDLLWQYLRELFRARLQQPGMQVHPDDELAALGIDSVRAMELVNTLNQELGICLEPTWVFTANTAGGLLATIEVALWVAQPQAAGQDIIL